MRPTDTSAAAQHLLDEHYRRMSPIEKAEALTAAWHLARTMQLAGLRLQHPAASDAELEGLLVQRWLGPALFAKAREK